MDYQLIVQIITFIASCGLFLHTVIWMAKEHLKWYMGLAPAAYLLHTLIFYGAVIVCELYGTTLSQVTGIYNLSGNWSSVLRLHGIATVGSYLYVARQCSRKYGEIK